MNQQSFPSNQRRIVERSGGLPEPEYVDEVFEDIEFVDEEAIVPETVEETGPASVEPGEAPDPGNAAVVQAKLASPPLTGVSGRAGPLPETPKKSPASTTFAGESAAPPAAKPDGRAYPSRIPHRQGAPNRADKAPGKEARVRRPPEPPAPRLPMPRPPAARGAAPIAQPPPRSAVVDEPPARSPSPAAPSLSEPLTRTTPPMAPQSAADPEPAAPIPAWVLLETVLEQNADLPEGSLILGVRADGKPLVLALDDYSMGAALITGDAPEANRKHLRAILASAEKLNSPELLQVDVVTRAKERYETDSSILRRVCAAADPCVFDLLGETLEEIETRRRSDRQLPFRLLVIDEIDELVSRLAEDSLRYLRWMMRRGPRVGVWIFASIESGRLPDFDAKTYRSFELRLFGKILERETAERYTEIPAKVLEKLAQGAEGCLKLDNAVIRFNIPEFAG